MKNRRQFLTAAAASAALITSQSSAEEGDAGALTAATAGADGYPGALRDNPVILFQGDSITDAKRNRESKGANDMQGLGYGYPAHIAGAILRDLPDYGLQIYNRGISGNKVPDLDARWEEDVIQLKPGLLSILIGVNDLWHKRSGKYDGTAETYRDGFAALLARTEKALPKTRIVVCEPFVLRCGHITDDWFPEFETRRAFAESVATDAGVTWVPFQTMFNEAVAAGTAPEYWAADGVHPTAAGHALMAQTWRETVGI